MSNEFTHYPLFMDAITDHVLSQGAHSACIFQPRAIDTAQTLDYQSLGQQVNARAQLLLELGYYQQKVALIYPSGLDFVVNFLACLSAGIIAVPLNVTRNEQQFERTIRIFEDADVTTILTTSETKKTLIEQLNGVETLSAKQFTWIDEKQVSLSTSFITLPTIKPDDIAFIQYTSGSTSLPKGVLVSQGNIVDNMKAIQRGCDHVKGVILGGWLPQFHDMGLIGHMLHPLYMAGTYVFMPPMSFIQRPRRWLELISHYKIFCVASPNFGYEHCNKFISDDEDLSHIDLSCWKVALNGSEPVNAETMKTFSKKFARCGFQENAFYPSYGMAETTLFVSGGPRGSGVSLLTLEQEDFGQGKITTAQTGNQVVNCGLISPHFNVKIVNPISLQPCAQDEVGEIWINGESVAQGYLNNSEKTTSDFQATLMQCDGNQYLRTGDLGFIDNGMLYVTGRRKEVMIIRGRNLYPYDIERTCNNYEHAMGNNGSAIFTFEEAGNIKLGGIIEIKKSALKGITEQVLKSDLLDLINSHHDITLDKLLVVKPGVLPKTTSGKIKRTACSMLLN